jgi:hypothetical protein
LGGGAAAGRVTGSQSSRANEQEAALIVPAISLYVVLVWFLWGFVMALGWALGTWIAGQLIGARWTINRG